MENTHRIFILILFILSNGHLVVRTVPFNCDFDDGFCNWTTVRSERYNIEWGRQQTSTLNTGPDSDHTSGVGSFIYINTSQELVQKRARQVSPWQSRGKYCLSFWYYMYGRHTDKLWIASIDETAREKQLFFLSISSNPSKIWKSKSTVFIREKKFKILIQGTIADDNTNNFGYIAVDDVKMFHEECPNRCSYPSTEYVKAVIGDFWEGSVVNISCIEGYELKGNSSIKCQDDGEWSDIPTCQPVDCGKLTSGNDIIEVKSENTTITLSCAQGFTMVGNSSMICMTNGNWYILPRCVINNCSDPTLTSGNVSSTNFSVGSSVKVSCDTSYKLIGDSQIYCQINSTWSDYPLCERIDTSKGTDNSLVKSDPGTLIAVGVIVPLFAVSIFAIAIVIVCRLRSSHQSNPMETDGHSRIAQITGMEVTYANSVQTERNTEPATEMSLNTYERLNVYANSTEGMYQQFEISNKRK